MSRQPGFQIGRHLEIKEIYTKLIELFGGQMIDPLHNLGRDSAKTAIKLSNDQIFLACLYTCLSSRLHSLFPALFYPGVHHFHVRFLLLMS